MNLDHYRSTLETLRADLEARLARLDQHGREGLPADFAEQTASRANDEVVDGLELQVRTEMTEVGNALRRIELGTYGRCTRCGEAIAAARLDALPFAATCTRCA